MIKKSVEFGPGVLIWIALLILVFPLRWCIAAMLAALVHEIFHLLSIKAFGGNVYGFHLYAGEATMEADGLSGGKGIICSLAGPVGGLLPVLLMRWMPRTAICAIAYSIYNLLPIYPLDGGRVIRTLLTMTCPENLGTKIEKIIESSTRVGLIVIGVLILLNGKPGIMPFIFFLMMALSGKKIKIPCQKTRQAVQ